VAVHLRLRVTGIIAASALLLSGCILPFPPFWIPGDPGFETPAAITVENQTDDDWVLALDSGFSSSFAIPAGEAGTVLPWDAAPDELVLLDTDCGEVDRIPWADSTDGVLIQEPGTLAAGEAEGADGVPFLEYWECGEAGFLADPESVAVLPGATDADGVIALVVGDGRPYMYHPTDGAIEPVGAEASGEVYDAEFTWTLDGARVAFSRMDDTTGASSVWVGAADGSDAELLVEDAASPRWSPDGSRLAYLEAGAFAPTPTLWVVDVESGERTELAVDATLPAWSPDSSQLAFFTGGFSAFEPEPEATELRVVGADGTGLRTVAAGPPFAFGPAWSPDGTQLAFTAATDGAAPSLFEAETVIVVCDLADDNVTTVATVNGASLSEPAWSPDGSSIGFIILDGGFLNASGAVGVVPAAGGEVVRIGEKADAYLTTPAWSPDGTWIVAGRSDETGFTSELVALDPTGAEAEVVLATGILSVSAWLAVEPG
jgi:WD40 repeat protein